MVSSESRWFPLPRRPEAASRVARPEREPLSPDEVSMAVVDCAVYEEGRRKGGKVPLETALGEATACRDGFVWIGLHDPSPEVIETIGEHFHLHPLAVEDAVHAHQRPKLEKFGDSLFLVLKTAQYVDSEELVQIGEVMVFLGARFVVTVRHGEASPLHEVRLDLEAHPELMSIGPSSVLYAIADRIVDDYEVVLEGIAVDVDEVEAEVFSGAGTSPAERVYRLKREVLEFKRAVTPAIGPLERLAAGEAKLPLDPRTGAYFGDVLDHLRRDSERIAAFDELLTGVLQANIAQLTLRDNRDLRKISAWVAIIAVPTMVFGLYGMNFEHMPELEWEYGYPAVVAVVLAICSVLYWRFKKSGWL